MLELENTTRSADWSATENERLINALSNANRHGQEVHALLEIHSQGAVRLFIELILERIYVLYLTVCCMIHL